MTVRPPNISIGTKERDILRYLKSLKNERSNIRNYSNSKGLNRTTVIDNLNRLISKGLVIKEHIGSYIITKRGIDYLDMSESVRTDEKSVRSPCRTEALSVHYFKYSVFLKKIDLSRLEELDATNIKKNKLPNFTEYYLYFEDCTISIKKNQIIIHLTDIIEDNTEEAHWKGFHKCMDYILKIKKIAEIEGLKIFGKPHYARVESYLSKKLSMIDNKYRLGFPDGTSFWIDYSDKREDETDNALYRERIDEIFLDAKKSKSVLSDVDKHDIDLDKIKEILLLQIKLESVKSSKNITSVFSEQKNIGDNSYFG